MALGLFKLFDYLFGAPDRGQKPNRSEEGKTQTRSTTAASRAAARITNADMLQKIKCWACGSYVPLATYFEHLQMKSEVERKGYIPCVVIDFVVRTSFGIFERSTYEAQLPFEAGAIIQAIQQSFAFRGVANNDMGAVQFARGECPVYVRNGIFAGNAAQPYSQPLKITFPMTFLGGLNTLPKMLAQKIATECRVATNDIKFFARLQFRQSGESILKEIDTSGKKEVTEVIRKMRDQERAKKGASGANLLRVSIMIAINLLPSIPRASCTICFEDQIINEFTRLPTSRCTHDRNICDAAITENIKANLDSTAWDRIMCPAEGCPEFFQYEDLQVHLNAEDFQR